MNLKKIQAMPFAPFCVGKAMVRWRGNGQGASGGRGDACLWSIFLKNTACVTYTREIHPPSASCAPRKAKR